MSTTLFWQPYASCPASKILYKSKAVLETTQASYEVFITQTCIRFHEMCLPFVFELKFGMAEGQIYFELEHQVMRFHLPNKDEKVWRDHLKHHLNQKGFH